MPKNKSDNAPRRDALVDLEAKTILNSFERSVLLWQHRIAFLEEINTRSAGEPSRDSYAIEAANRANDVRDALRQLETDVAVRSTEITSHGQIADLINVLGALAEQFEDLSVRLRSPGL